jgi:hypothetical protein
MSKLNLKRKRSGKGDGKEVKKNKTRKLKSEADVLEMISRRSLDLTGLFPGDLAMGVGCTAKTALFRLAENSPILGPRSEDLAELAKFPHLEGAHCGPLRPTA